MRFTVHTNMTEAIAVALADRKDRAGRVLAEQVKKDTSPFVPMLTGSLDEQTRVEGDTIIYPGPYARFLYYGKVMIYPPTGSTYAPENERKVVTDRNLVFSKREGHAQAQAFWFEASKAQNLDKWLKAAQREVNNGR